MLALISPKSGSFNVTTKGGVVEKEFFDWKFALPILILLGLNLTGIIVALVKLYLGSDAYGTLLLNLFWVAINSMILAAGVNVAVEAKQIRNTPRVSSRLPATLILSGGETIACHTTDFSSTGVGLALPEGHKLVAGEEIHVSIVRGHKEAIVPGTVSNAGRNVGINFDALTLQQLRDITAVTFSTADMWLHKTGKSKPKTPFASLIEIFFYSRLTFSRAFKNVFMRQRSIAKDVR
jgi:cellulose synthase (UDP-forming)